MKLARCKNTISMSLPQQFREGIVVSLSRQFEDGIVSAVRRQLSQIFFGLPVWGLVQEPLAQIHLYSAMFPEEKIVAAMRRQFNRKYFSSFIRREETFKIMGTSSKQFAEFLSEILQILSAKLEEKYIRASTAALLNSSIMQQLAAQIISLFFIRMSQFYETYSDDEKVSPLVRRLPWTHNLRLDFYAINEAKGGLQ